MDWSIRALDLVAGNIWAAADVVVERLLRRDADADSGAKLQLGRTGERLAARHLRRRGYRIVARNFRAAGCEIDLIAIDRGTIVFVEVKTRTDDSFGLPAEAVDGEKRERIYRAAAAFAAQRRATRRPTRFDVVAILGPRGALKLEHLKDAF